MEPNNTNPSFNSQSPNPSFSPAPQKVNPEHSSSIGTIVAVIVVLAVIALGALYFWSQRGQKGMENTSELETQEIVNQSTSDETASIEADLNATEIDSLDAELDVQ